MARNFISIFLFCFIFSCVNNPKDEEVISNDTSKKISRFSSLSIVVGEVVANLKCESNSSFSYSVYLPKSYNPVNNSPVIIFFDPHAKSNLPLEKYKNLSEKYSLILISSSDSKNGLSPEIYPEIYKAIKSEVRSKYHADLNRIYCAGFSGGARVAINIGLSDKGISGVIANSAGFEPSRSPIHNDFVFAGIAGAKDFNLLEQRRTEASLTFLPVSHLLIEFDGGHDWAPEVELERAFVFLEISNKNKSPRPKIDSIIKKYLDNQVVEFNKTSGILIRYQVLKKLLPLLINHAAYTDKKNELEKIAKSKEVLLFQRELEEISQREAILQGDYFQKIFSKSLEWWDKEVKNMNSDILGKEYYLMNQRLKSYLSLAVYMTLSSPEAKQDMFLLEKLIEIYSLVDPSNPEWAYQKAVLRASQGNTKEAEQLLLESINLGFSEKDRFFSQQELAQFQKNQEIISRLK